MIDVVLNWVGGVVMAVFLSLSLPVQASASAMPGESPVFVAAQQDNGAIRMAQDSNYPVSASDAAAIAQDSVPGSRVVRVELLPDGEYAVTLKTNGSVTRVMVNANDGSTN